MDELEQLKQKKVEELQQQIKEKQAEQAKVQQQINMLEQMVTSRLSKEALERYGNIKTAHPERAVQLLTILGQVIQEKNLERIEDEELKQLLQLMQSQTREINIKRK